MKEIKSIINAYNSIDFRTTKAALATVVRVQGSSYRRTGARMLILDNGIYYGGISGGCLEGDALRRAQKAMFKNTPSIITYDTMQDDDHQVGIGLGCNGIIDVLITPLHNDDEDHVRLLSLISETREPCVLVSIIEYLQTPSVSGKAFLFKDKEQFQASFPLKDIAPLISKDVSQALKTQASEIITYTTQAGSVKIFIEVIRPEIHLVIYGSNYDILPLAIIARELGWKVTVVTRVAKTNKLLIKTASVIIDNKSEQRPPADRYSAIVLMAHDYNTDLNNLKMALQTKAPYIGLLGPRKRGDKMLDELHAAGYMLSEQDMARIYAPCGLDIGAANPEEIALSIAAEIRAHFAARMGTHLKFRQGEIYSD